MLWTTTHYGGVPGKDGNVVDIFNSAIFSFVSLARVLVSEKEGRMKEALRMMGLPDLIYHGSWLITFQAQVVNRTPLG